MACKRIQSQLESYLSGQLDPSIKERIKKHISSCPACRKEITILQHLNSRLNCQPVIHAPEDFTQRVMANVSRSIVQRYNSTTPYRQWGVSLIAAGLVLAVINMTPLMPTLQLLPKKVNHETSFLVSRFQSWSLRNFQQDVTNGFYDFTDIVTRPVNRIHNLY